MGVQRTAAVVIGRRPLGESDRLVDFYTLAHGRLRGVAKSVRRVRSRMSGALELFSAGELVFFETARSDLVRIDHFDVSESFLAVREDLERLGEGAWVVECVNRLSADRDANPELFRLVLRSLRALAVAERPAWVSVCFALRAVDLLGHRPRIDCCVACGRRYPFSDATLDVAEGGLVCSTCASGSRDSIPLPGSVVGVLARLRSVGWHRALGLALAPRLDRQVGEVVEELMARLAGQRPRSSRFLGQVRRALSLVAEPRGAFRVGEARRR